ncbi:MAG: bifunctional riboflavin kinase/FAD synthetase [Deltaproteobacteria bacterium]|jgi:riboflavin kinase/FMN adenylyltransferase|nr:bifunctional riboflavin kinase/FAD synthetase [Deltaproteobacteria bacterium]
MRVVHSLEEFARTLGPDAPHAVTVGNFDGVHRGHRELVRVTRERAARKGARSVLVTFDPHPAHVVRGVESPGLLTPLPRKLELLDAAGLDATLVLSFTKAMSAMSAEDFVRAVLCDALHATDFVAGYNFALGKDRRGDHTALCALGERYGFAVSRVNPVIADRETVSSTLIREHLRSGEIGRATALLGRMHSVDGTVAHGQARGKKLGFPTANIDFGKTLLPARGAYATWFRVLSGEASPPLPSMTNIGVNPTFGVAGLTLETHVLDFSGDLYGKNVRLYFASRLRPEVRFQSVEDLVARLRKDEAAARGILGKGAEPSLL